MIFHTGCGLVVIPQYSSIKSDKRDSGVISAPIVWATTLRLTCCAGSAKLDALMLATSSASFTNCNFKWLIWVFRAELEIYTPRNPIPSKTRIIRESLFPVNTTPTTLPLKLIAHAPDCYQTLWLFRIIFYFLPQPPDVDIDCAGVPRIFVTPNFFQQLVAAENQTFITGQKNE